MQPLLNMAREKFLRIEPQELTFRVEPMMQASCNIRLYNNSREHLAFKVMTTNPEKYFVRPNIGVLLPRSACDVKVTMHGLEEVPPDLQCRDKFLIKSAVASPGDTVEEYRTLFNGNGHTVESCKLRVVYVLPSRQRSSNFEISGQGSPYIGSAVRQRSVNDNERQDGNEWDFGDLFLKSITAILVCLVSCYLIMQILPLIWSLGFMIMVFVIKLGQRLVSDSIEDWIGKTVLYICIHYITAFFRRGRNSGSGGSNVG